MKNAFDKLDAITSGRTSPWLEQAKKRVQDAPWADVSFKIGLAILRELRQRGMTQKELADKMIVSPQYINRVVRGKENLSLETISAIGKALSIDLILAISKFQASIDAPGIIAVGTIKMVYKSHSSPAHLIKIEPLQLLEAIATPYLRAGYYVHDLSDLCEVKAA